MEEKKTIMTEIALAYEEIIQLEQALIELDEQNTMNALEIRKREAKIFILQRQAQDIIEELKSAKENIQEDSQGDGLEPSELVTINKNLQSQ